MATSKTAPKNPAAERLSAVLSDENGLDFTVGFVDRVVRTDDVHAAADALAEVGKLAPETMSALDHAQIKAGAALAKIAPQVVVPAARTRLRQMVGNMVVDARDKQFGKTSRKLTADGHRLNINLLGEAVLGDGEADHHLEETHRLLAREDVDYVSVKVSSVASQISMWAFDETVDYVVERLRLLYATGLEGPDGPKFVNLDMEEYQDLELTIAVFTRLLSEPELQGPRGRNRHSGLPARCARRGAAAERILRRTCGQRRRGIKIRLVKGANLALETVHAEIAGWPVTTCDSKQSTDANYKRVLHWLLTPERMKGLRIGVAGHNLFDIAFAHHLSVDRSVTDRVEFEMLQGMASVQGRRDRGRRRPPPLRPGRAPEGLRRRVSYLVAASRRTRFRELHVRDLRPRQRQRHVQARGRSVHRRCRRPRVDPRLRGEKPRRHPTPPPPQPPPGPLGRSPRRTVVPTEFSNEPDTDPSLPANQEWAGRSSPRRPLPGTSTILHSADGRIDRAAR